MRYQRGTKSSRFPDSTASTSRSATSSRWMTARRKNALRRTVRWGKPSVSTNPGRTVCTLTPRGPSSPVSDRENASWACFEAAYGPAGANATVPATETTLTTCAPCCRPRSNARAHQTPPR
jgi:hypothetical protein